MLISKDEQKLNIIKHGESVEQLKNLDYLGHRIMDDWKYEMKI